MIRKAAIFLALVVSGCGDSSDGPPPPENLQSPGGNWNGAASLGRPVNLVISETGELRALLFLSGAGGSPLYGVGSVKVSGTDVVKGEFRVRNLFDLEAVFSVSSIQRCTVTGNVRERSVLSVLISCSTDFETVFDEVVIMLADANYETGSSLDDLAGNYAMRLRPDSDMLNITADGTIFGTFGIGPGCTINGRASEIDTRFNLLAVSWTLSACTQRYEFDEGAEYDGFAMRLPGAAMPGSYALFLTAERPLGLAKITETYDPT